MVSLSWGFEPATSGRCWKAVELQLPGWLTHISNKLVRAESLSVGASPQGSLSFLTAWRLGTKHEHPRRRGQKLYHL